jgi:hypothetical protein
VVTLLELLGPGGFIGGPDIHDPEVGLDTSVDLGGDVTVRGTGSGMPSSYPSWQPVTLYVDRATIMPGLHEVDLPLASLTLIDAYRIGVPWTRRKAVDARWQLHVSGEKTDLTFRGGWVFLAHLGVLGNWPEPS